MASAYGYITIAELESYTVTDYSSVDASYTDAVVESFISQAERLINVYLSQTYSVTIPDGVVYAALEISMKIAWNRMIFDGFVDRTNIPPYKQPYIDSDISTILDKYKAVNVMPSGNVRMYEDGGYNGEYIYGRFY